ncbi:MAG: STAS domain-containing protein [Chlorobiaceae bacterium]|nr:STAS domain-containing protein [Chlorobiaceae bacterium]
MIITETTQNGISVVTLNGTLDALSCPEFRANPAVGDPGQTVVLDLEKVDFIDSSGLGSIVGAARKKRQQECDLFLACMNDKVRKVFEITNAQKLFHIFDDTGAAVEFAAMQQEACK